MRGPHGFVGLYEQEREKLTTDEEKFELKNALSIILDMFNVSLSVVGQELFGIFGRDLLFFWKICNSTRSTE